ncbi:tigger transposable element-derived protein 1-like [Melanaphis sacchari]|uniref:tigger transposable element-derived protein 1-like n=1 Tax=Melanaphis sacchari TaxID=742174 RepID=UPI000DC1305F|nr:tigger transposable element-derived protein 1-like [Melanaphis sacchari]
MLPPNTTSVSQPMDQGVIYTFKSYYRKFMLQSLVCKIDNFTSVHQLATSITVLDAVNWISLSCNSLKIEFDQNCFRKAGFLIDGLDVNPNENTLSEIQEIFVALDFDQEEFLHIDDQLETQQTHDSAISMIENKCEKDGDNDESQEEPKNLVKDYKTANYYLEELQKFSLTVSNSRLLDLTSKAKDKLNITFSPKTVFADFEKAIHLALLKVWPSISLKGCRFHLAQSWWRKIQTIG